MRFVHALIATWHRLTALVRRGRLDRDIQDEVAFHLAMRQAADEHDGQSPVDASRGARRAFGNVAALKEETREMWTFPSFESLVQDVRFAFRILRRSPGFTIVAIAVLAIGIGANTAIFSLVDAMLVRGLPYPQPDRLMVLIGNVQRAEVERRGGSYLDYLDWRARSTSFDDMAAFAGVTLTLTGDGDAEQVTAEGVSAPYFAVLGVTPARGRVFRAEEDQVADRDFVVILSDGLWTRRFGADPSIVGRTVRLGPRAFEVVGVMPPGFAGVTDQAEAWVPFVLSGNSLDNRGNRGLQAVARLRADVPRGRAQSELDEISRQLEAEHPQTNSQRGVEVSPLSTETFGQLQTAVFALMAAVTFVLLIACANVANLLIGRSETRQREIAVRTALGAGRARLVRQLVTESCALALAGGLTGLVLAWLALPALLTLSPIALPSFAAPQLSVSVLLFTMGASLVCGILLGVAPSMHARTAGLGEALKDSARGSSRAAQRTRTSLVVVEVGLAVVLLVGAGLMIRTVQNLLAVEPGFDVDSVLTLNIDVPRGPSTSVTAVPGAPPSPPPPFVASSDVLLDQLTAVPGVTRAALVSDLPLGGSSSAVFYSADGDLNETAATRPRAYIHRVTPAFFDTLGISLRAGRAFTTADQSADGTAVIVSAAVVGRFWPNEDGVGRRIRIGNADAPWLTIVGVVPELKYRGLPQNPTADPDLFFPYRERGSQSAVVRTAVDPASVVASVRAAIRQAGPDVVTSSVAPLSELADAQTAQSRFTTWLMGLFAAAALLLSIIGLYGVMSYLVTQRRREFGIRVALGATRPGLVGVVLKEGARLVMFGLALGAAAAIGLSRLLDSLLFGLPSIAGTAVVAVSVLAVVAMAACLVPALNATRVDPVVALRND